MPLIPPEPHAWGSPAMQMATQQEMLDLWRALNDLQVQVTGLAEQFYRFLEVYKDEMGKQRLRDVVSSDVPTVYRDVGNDPS